jgi:type VI secretion system protein ImpM
MQPANDVADVAQTLAWFGKLPSAGDFISRRMPYALQQYWDRWCAGGMESLKERNPVSGWALWGAMPKWAFLLPAQSGVPFAQLGVISPSCDRVGRNFPFLVSTVLNAENAGRLIPRAALIALAWSAAITEAQMSRSHIEVLDKKLLDLLALGLAQDAPVADGDVTLPPGVNPQTLPWPDLGASFDMQGSESYWWSVPPASTGFRARTHMGPLSAHHFSMLGV